MNRQIVAQWGHELKTGKSDVHDEGRGGRPSIVTDKTTSKTEETLCFRHLMIEIS